MILNLGSHLSGAVVTALVDDQLPDDEAERAWAHVVDCPGCRTRVEHEGWIKRRLSGLAVGHTLAEETVPDDLTARMHAVHAWAAVAEIERAGRRRSALVLGAGSVGLAVVGLMALTSAPAGRGEVPTSPGTSVQTNIGASLGGSARTTQDWLTPSHDALRRAAR